MAFNVPISSVMAASSSMVFRAPFGPGIDGSGFIKQAYIDAQAIDLLAANIRSFKKPLEEALREVVVPSIRTNFEQQGRPKWRPLSEATLINRGWRKTKTIRRGPLSLTTKNPIKGFKILDRTGRLRKAATQLNMWDIANDQLSFRVTFFSQKVPYGPFHQLGTDQMYARQFITLGGANDQDNIRLIFDQWLIARIERYWGTVTYDLER